MRTEQKHAWIYLFNLGFYILPMLIFPYSLPEIFAMTLVMLAFVALYFYCYAVPTSRIKWPLLGMYVLACAITPINSGSIALFSYIGFFIGFAYNLRVAVPLLGGVVLTLAGFHFGVGTHWDLFLHYGVVIVITVSSFGRVERLRQLHRAAEQRSEAETERLAATVERERIARDLHDILGHSLSTIILKSDLAQKQLARHQYDEATQQLHDLSDIARSSLSQVRESVSGYKHGGLKLELTRLLQRLEDGGFTTEFAGDLPNLDAQRETAVILALTELITNIIRHSEGNHCVIAFNEGTHSYAVEVSDNGSCKELSLGNGLHGVRERMRHIGGEVDIRTESGCQVEVTFPKVGLPLT